MTLATAPSKAAVIYTFVGSDANFGPRLTVGFQISVPTFVNPTLDVCTIVTFGSAQLTSNTNLFCPGSTNTVQFSNQDNFGNYRPPNSATILVIDRNNAGVDFTFPAGAVGSVGVYTANGELLNTGTLTVTQTPEPSTLFLTGAGILAAIMVRKRISGRTSV